MHVSCRCRRTIEGVALLALLGSAGAAGVGRGAPVPSAPGNVSSAVRQAREILDARSRALKALQSEEGVRIREEGVRTEIQLPVFRLFTGQEPDPSAGSARFLEALKDYITTFHTPYVSVSWPAASEGAPEAVRLDARRAVSLGFLFLQRCGLAPERLFVRSRKDGEGRVRIGVYTLRPRPEALDGEFQPVLVHAPRRTVSPGGAPVPLDVVLLDPARIKRWGLFILSPEGDIVRHFEGRQDLHASLSWNGADQAGRPVGPGFYQAFLSAENWASQVRTDSLALLVPRPPAAKRAVPPPAPPPPPAKAGKDVAKWFHVVLFEKGKDDIPGPMALAVEQAARALRLYPGRKVAVEGFASPDEPGARRLAERRAAAVRDALVGKHGVAAPLVLAKGNPPRTPLDGEAMSKVLIFFLEE